ncbi:MAG: hypothetical protein GTO46_00715, partial [Gemmatimonadetes bacterium]|nr:hypothetical protein [Gemmatimonadota bacterium]NIP63245.1 hypothetical protein [Gammaproteobacteria bacterium]
PPSPWYQIRKFAKRNRALVGSAAAIVIVLVVAVIATSLSLVRAMQAEAKA